MPAITSFARRQGCSIADGRTDRRCRRIRAQLVSLPMKRVVISRRTCKHCNASTASVFRRGSAGPRGTSAGTASPSAARPSRTSVRLSGTSRFPCPQVLSSCYWHYYYFCSYCWWWWWWWRRRWCCTCTLSPVYVTDSVVYSKFCDMRRPLRALLPVSLLVCTVRVCNSTTKSLIEI